MVIHYVEDYEQVTGRKRAKQVEAKVITSKSEPEAAGSDVEPVTKSEGSGE